MCKYVFRIFLFLCITKIVSAQSKVDFILQDIEKNNNEIQSGKQWSEAKKSEYKTGIFLKNPSVEFDYLMGSPTNIGNQTELMITQDFDFPNVYSKRKKVAEMQVSSVEMQSNILRQEILLEAKQFCMEIIYFNKKKAILKQRYENAKSLLDKFEKRLKTGDVNLLDFNKIKINLLNSDNELQTNQTRINLLMQKLSGANGNNPITLNDTVYPAIEKIPDVSEIQKQFAENDPLLKMLISEKDISTAQVALAKALSLPKLQAGFHSQSNAGMKFNGLHFGVTIPLWENKNTVKYAVAKTNYSTSQIDNRKNQINSKILEIYNNYISIRKNMDDYNQVLNSINSLELLEKSQQAGHISAIEYLLEINFINEAIDKYLQLEFEWNKALTYLFQFR